MLYQWNDEVKISVKQNTSEKVSSGENICLYLRSVEGLSVVSLLKDNAVCLAMVRYMIRYIW